MLVWWGCEHRVVRLSGGVNNVMNTLQRHARRDVAAVPASIAVALCGGRLRVRTDAPLCATPELRWGWSPFSSRLYRRSPRMGCCVECVVRSCVVVLVV